MDVIIPGNNVQHGVSTCEKCHQKNHWKSQCDIASKFLKKDQSKSSSRHRSLSRKRHSGKSKNKSHNVRKVEAESGSDSDESTKSTSIFVQSVRNIHKVREQLQATLKIQNMKQKLIVQVDTGAEANILPTRCFRKLFPTCKTPSECASMKPSPLVTLATYDGSPLKHHGSLTLHCSADSQESKWHKLNFYVCDTDGPIILRLSDSRLLDLITVNPIVQQVAVSTVNAQSDPDTNTPIKNNESLMSMYPDRFEGLGKFPQKASLQLKENAVPVVHAPRRCPVHLKKDIQSAIDAMELQGIIEKIPSGQPTEWLSSLAYARKSNGKLRVCLDPRDLSANLKRTYHRAPTVEDITYKLANATIFSKLDAKDGYWSIQLDDESSLLTAFNSPSSNQRYKFNRLPFGVNVSQDLFQEAMDEITRDLDGVISIADDLCVYGSSEAEHDRNLHQLMLKARSHGLVLNKNKCHIKVPEITFFGSVYSRDGVKPDPARTQEIKDLTAPNNKQQVMSFLGMIQYMSAHISHLSDLTAPFRELTKKDVDFTWTSTHQQAFQKLKSAVSEATTLCYFNPEFKTKLQVDASKRGLGAALIQIDPVHPQKERIVAFASKSLSEVESRYANIERKLLAFVFGIEKFHTYVFGSNVLVESDHKPLETIVLKNIAQAPPRLQRILL